MPRSRALFSGLRWLRKMLKQPLCMKKLRQSTPHSAIALTSNLVVARGGIDQGRRVRTTGRKVLCRQATRAKTYSLMASKWMPPTGVLA